MATIEEELAGLVNTVNKDVLDQDIQTHYGSGSTSGSNLNEIRMKVEGEYTFFVCPPFVEFNKDTSPWGGRYGLVVKNHWNLLRKDGKTNGFINDAAGSFPWLGLTSPLNDVIKRWQDKGMIEEVKENISNESVYFNVLLIDSPDPEHKKFLQTVGEDGKLTNEITVCVLESNLTTLKFLQESSENKFVKHDLSDPLNGSLVSVVKEVKMVKGSKRTSYKRTIVPHSPMWFEGQVPQADQVASIKNVLANLPNLYDAYKPGQYYAENIKEYAETMDNFLSEKFKYFENSNSLGTNHSKEFASMPATPAPVAPAPVAPVAPVAPAPVAKPFVEEDDNIGLPPGF